MTWSASKYTTKPGYSQREIGGLPTAGTLVTGSPNLAATWPILIPRLGVATSDSFTAMPFSTATVAAPARPAANTAASSRFLYPMAHLIGLLPKYYVNPGLRNYSTAPGGQYLIQLTL